MARRRPYWAHAIHWEFAPGAVWCRVTYQNAVATTDPLRVTCGHCRRAADRK